MESTEQKFKQKYSTKSHRMPNYDYSSGGGYFLTICCYDKECLFGEVVDGEMVLNELGEIVHDEWQKTSEIRPNVVVDEFIVMPNHVHGILILNSNKRRDTEHRVSTEAFGKPTKNSIPTIIRSYKATVTKKINERNNYFCAKIWQPNYHDRIIRNENELNRIREYIQQNPNNWEDDNLESIFM